MASRKSKRSVRKRTVRRKSKKTTLKRKSKISRKRKITKGRGVWPLKPATHSKDKNLTPFVLGFYEMNDVSAEDIHKHILTLQGHNINQNEKNAITIDTSKNKISGFININGKTPEFHGHRTYFQSKKNKENKYCVLTITQNVLKDMPISITPDYFNESFTGRRADVPTSQSTDFIKMQFKNDFIVTAIVVNLDAQENIRTNSLKSIIKQILSPLILYEIITIDGIGSDDIEGIISNSTMNKIISNEIINPCIIGDFKFTIKKINEIIKNAENELKAVASEILDNLKLDSNKIKSKNFDKYFVYDEYSEGKYIMYPNYKNVEGVHIITRKNNEETSGKTQSVSTEIKFTNTTIFDRIIHNQNKLTKRIQVHSSKSKSSKIDTSAVTLDSIRCDPV
jgi:hypothetical protein